MQTKTNKLSVNTLKSMRGFNSRPTVNHFLYHMRKTTCLTIFGLLLLDFFLHKPYSLPRRDYKQLKKIRFLFDGSDPYKRLQLKLLPHFYYHPYPPKSLQTRTTIRHNQRPIMRTYRGHSMDHSALQSFDKKRIV